MELAVKDDEMSTSEALRRKLWIEVATAIAQCENCASPGTIGKYADAALCAYDSQFHPVVLPYEEFK